MYQRYLRRHGLIQLVTCSINLRKHEHADRHEKYISVFCHFSTLRWKKLLKSFLMEYEDLILLHRQYHVDALLVRDQLTISYHFGSGNGLVPSADKPSSEPVFGRYRCHNTVSIVHNELILIQKMFLTHWGRVTHICVGKSTIIGSDNGSSPGRRQAIIWTNAVILLIETLGTNFS